MRKLGGDAKAIASRGWGVFPLHTPNGDACDCNRACVSPAKHPRTKNGLLDASVDPLTVSRWWEDWPAANIGIATGPSSGLVVVDIDPRDGGDKEWFELRREHGEPPIGPVVSTGGGGWHYYFRHDGSSKITSRKLAGCAGVDIKGDGGYVIGPPSVHITGVSYEWCEGMGPELPVPDMPGWLRELVGREPERSGEAGPTPDVIGPGSRNATLTREGGAIRRRGAGETEIFAYLSAINEARCDPPLERAEVAKIAASVYRYEPEPETPVVVDVGRPVRGKRAAPSRPAYVPQTFTAAELMARELSPVKWAVPDLLPEGLGILAGKPKLGKSWMSFNIGIAIAQGGLVMGAYPVDDADALILALEDNPRRLQSRIGKILGDDRPPERLHMETAWPREDEGGVEALDAWLGQHPTTCFVVIDTLAKFRPRSIDAKYADDYAAIEGLQQLAGRHGVCILLITHYRKAFSDDWLDNVTGTLGIAGAADTILGLERPRGVGGQGEAVLHVTGRDVEEQDLALRWDMVVAQWVVMGEAAEYRMSREMLEVVTTVNRDGGVRTAAAWAPLLNRKRNAAWMALNRAADADHIARFDGGLYGPRRADASTGGPTAVDGAVDADLIIVRADRATIVDGKENENESNRTFAVDAVDGDTRGRTSVRPPSTASTESGENGANGARPPPSRPPPEGTCPTCGGRCWSQRVGARWMCDVCQPAIVAVAR